MELLAYYETSDGVAVDVIAAAKNETPVTKAS